MSRDVLAMIDGAIEDWETSGDAMRWTPDRKPEAPTTERAAADLVASVRRGIVTSLPSGSWSPTAPASNMLDDLRRAIRLIEALPPQPARFEVDDLATARGIAEPEDRPSWRLPSADDPFGIPVVVNQNLPLGGWRLLDRDGNVLHEGTVTT